MFLTGLAALAVVPTLPTAARALDGVSLFPLVAGSFVAASLLGGVLGGHWADRHGARLPLAAGMVLAVLTLVVSAASTSIWQLAAGRFLDGVAGGMVAVAINTAIGQAYPEHLRPRALALMSACWVVPSLVGPPLAGLVVDWCSWRAVFYGLAGLTLLPTVAVLFALRRLPHHAPVAEVSPATIPATAATGAPPATAAEPTTETATAPTTTKAPATAAVESNQATAVMPTPVTAAKPTLGPAEEPTPAITEPTPKADPDQPRPALLTAIGVSVGAALGQYGVSGWDLRHLLFTAGGLVALVLCAPRLLPPGTWRAARGLPAPVLLCGLGSGVFFTLEALVPLLLVTDRDAPPLVIGLAFTGAAVAWAAASWVQGNLLRGTARHRLVVAGACVQLGAVGVAVVGTLPEVPAYTAAAAMPLAAVGMGLYAPSLTVLSLAHSPAGRQGYASSAMQTNQNLGQISVLGLAAALLNAALALGASDTTGYAAAFGLLLVPTVGAALLAVRARQV
ncbi:MFS transporter [Streptomyces sp. HSW2009]|uniref:MFS transporter n=1 Tax=Streptomyces sp. HSW2009 TaxID=3142890 RepID=UPI0032F03700